LKNSNLLSPKSNLFLNGNILTWKRCLATKNNNTGGIDTHSDLYKPSTAKQETHVSDALRGHQPADTIDTKASSKVW
jgi:hypothetical protein